MTVKVEVKHLEQKEDEVFIGNFTRQRFYELPWVTKRAGQTVWGPDGRILGHGGRIFELRLVPVFVKRSEIQPNPKISILQRHAR